MYYEKMRKTRYAIVALLTIFAAFLMTTALASTDSEYVSMSVTLDGEELEYAGTYKVSGGEEIKVSAFSKNADIDFVAFYYENENDSEEEKYAAYINRTKMYKSEFSIMVHRLDEGEKRILWIEAVDKNDDGTSNTVTKTGWQAYFLEWEKSEAISVDAKYNNEVLSDKSKTIAETGGTLELVATPSDRVQSIHYRWDDDDFTEIKSSQAIITMPSPLAHGDAHYLYLCVRRASDGKYSTPKVYKFLFSEEATQGSLKDLDIESYD